MPWPLVNAYLTQAPRSLWVGLGVATVLVALLLWAWRRCASVATRPADPVIG